MSFRRRRERFGELIARQLDVFEAEERRLLEEIAAAERAYDEADRDEATHRYGDVVDLVETGTELLAAMRDAYGATLDEATAGAYDQEFNRAVARRFPRFGLEIEDR